MRVYLAKCGSVILAVTLLIALSGTTFLSGVALSASSAVTGNDISWPQCGRTYPVGQAFGIVGVNGGLANNTNPCLQSQLTWAQQSRGGTGQDKAAVYVNTANPGLNASVWPSSNDYGGGPVYNPYGTCDHTDTTACAYMYGYARAYDDVTSRGVAFPSNYLWWLDVETSNSWETNKDANTADLEGMTAYFQSVFIRVGIYSTTYQWGQIAGTVPSTSNLNNLKSWVPGARSLSGAQANCGTAPLTSGSPVTMTQYIAKNLDYNYSCI